MNKLFFPKETIYRKGEINETACIKYGARAFFKVEQIN